MKLIDHVYKEQGLELYDDMLNESLPFEKRKEACITLHMEMWYQVCMSEFSEKSSTLVYNIINKYSPHRSVMCFPCVFYDYNCESCFVNPFKFKKGCDDSRHAWCIWCGNEKGPVEQAAWDVLTAYDKF